MIRSASLMIPLVNSPISPPVTDSERWRLQDHAVTFPYESVDEHGWNGRSSPARAGSITIGT